MTRQWLSHVLGEVLLDFKSWDQRFGYLIFLEKENVRVDSTWTTLDLDLESSDPIFSK